ncbi:MAG: hypothetical protein BAJALOKI3v1_660006 [Promethearchaeota archaeon]|nr:MAG: hypothetical protein BAJALOKI3v1_660006 [Candidatus Lokiarchaeota archaeon]
MEKTDSFKYSVNIFLAKPNTDWVSLGVSHLLYKLWLIKCYIISTKK